MLILTSAQMEPLLRNEVALEAAVIVPGLREQLERFCVREDALLLFLGYGGSRLHGTNTPQSDTDVQVYLLFGVICRQVTCGKQGVYLTSMRKILLNAVTPQFAYKSADNVKNTSTDIDISLLSVHELLRRVCVLSQASSTAHRLCCKSWALATTMP
jgi:hypothetical protein